LKSIYLFDTLGKYPQSTFLRKGMDGQINVNKVECTSVRLNII